MEIQKEGGKFTIPCREWVAVHLDLPITYEYGSKRNAQRAATDPRRNTLTRVCDYAQRLFNRVVWLEHNLFQVKKITERYDFDDAGELIDDAGQSDGLSDGSAGDHTRAGAAIEGSAGAATEDGRGTRSTNSSP